MKFTETLASEKELLEKELALLEPKRKRLQLVTELIRLYANDERQAVLFEPNVGGTDHRFAKLGLSAAVMGAFRERPHQIMSPREVRETILAGGFTSESENLLVMVTGTCKRKTKGKAPELEEVKANGIRAFRLKAL